VGTLARVVQLIRSVLSTLVLLVLVEVHCLPLPHLLPRILLLGRKPLAKVQLHRRRRVPRLHRQESRLDSRRRLRLRAG